MMLLLIETSVSKESNIVVNCNWDEESIKNNNEEKLKVLYPQTDNNWNKNCRKQ